MKKILVTGANSSIGIQVIKYLLSEGKYEITAIDYRPYSKILKKMGNRITMIDDDINDNNVIEALIKQQDIVIHLQELDYNIINISNQLCNTIDYNITKIICDTIKYFNPNCYFLYLSSTLVESNKNNNNNNYLQTKINSEKYIKNNLSDYSIIRAPYIVKSPNENEMYNIDIKQKIDMVFVKDLSYAIVALINDRKDNNKLISKVSSINMTYGDFILNQLETFGITKYFIHSVLFDHNKIYYVPSKVEDLKEKIDYKCDCVNEYFNNLNKHKKTIKRLLPRILAIPFIIYYKNKMKEVKTWEEHTQLEKQK